MASRLRRCTARLSSSTIVAGGLSGGATSRSVAQFPVAASGFRGRRTRSLLQGPQWCVSPSCRGGDDVEVAEHDQQGYERQYGVHFTYSWFGAVALEGLLSAVA